MKDLQLTSFVAVAALMAATTLVVGLRVVVRASIKAFGVDDWLMSLAQVITIISSVLSMIASVHGLGLPDADVNPADITVASHYLFGVQILYLPAITAVKASICFALLRIITTKILRWVVYAILALSIVAGFIDTVIILAFCTPISANWTHQGKCHDPKMLLAAVKFFTVCSIITDVGCAVVPWFVLRNLQMRKSLKYTLAAILALGVFAVVATGVRTRWFDDIASHRNFFVTAAHLSMWSQIELCSGIILASLPCLRPLVKSLFGHGTSTTSRGGYATHNGKTVASRLGTSHQHQHQHQQEIGPAYRMNDVTVGRGDDADSEKGILGGTITVSTATDFSEERMHVKS